jgi:two-component system, NarL family, sensor kinase
VWTDQSHSDSGVPVEYADLATPPPLAIRARPWLLVGLPVVAVAVLVAAGLETRAGSPPPSLPQVGLPAAMALAYTLLGAVVLRHRRGHLLGLVMLGAGSAAALEVIAVSWAGWAPAGWVSQWAWWPPLALVPVALLVFPDGRLPSRRWWPLAVLTGLSATVATVAFAAAAAADPDGVLTRAVEAAGPARTLTRIALAGVAAEAVCAIGVLAALAVRWRRAGTDGRSQLVVLATAGVAVLLGAVLDGFNIPVAWLVGGVALPLGMTVAVLRHRLYDLDLHLHRALAWLLVSLAVLVLYVLVVDVVGAELSRFASVAGTVLVAVAFEPLRRLVQRGVDRLVFGRRDDPYAVLSRLGRQLADVVDPEEALPRLVRSVTEALRVPYTAVRVEGDPAAGDGPDLLVEEGRLAADPVRYPLTVHGRDVGALLVSPRRPGEGFQRREHRLLLDLARQAAVAVEAWTMTIDLRRSREQLVLAREEERRRLRSDLHDGVGPGLAGMSLQVRAAQRLLATDGEAAAVLRSLGDDLAMCSREVRGLVDQLRPPGLERGLVAAVTAQVDRVAGSAVEVRVDAPADLGPLPAAVEVAAYRIVTEAVTNVVRHAGARHCDVTLRRAGALLLLEVADDGRGTNGGRGSDAERPDGVGLRSMRERAAEIGGSLRVGPAEGGGTTVAARLPVHSGGSSA